MPCDTIRPLAVGGSIDQGFCRVLGPLRRPSWGSQRVGASDPEHSPMTGSKSERRIGRPIGCSRGDAPPFPSRTAHNVRGSLLQNKQQGAEGTFVGISLRRYLVRFSAITLMGTASEILISEVLSSFFSVAEKTAFIKRATSTVGTTERRKISAM